jgi:hypothetical protein
MPMSSVREDPTESKISPWAVIVFRLFRNVRTRNNPKARQPHCLAHRGGDADLGGEAVSTRLRGDSRAVGWNAPLPGLSMTCQPLIGGAAGTMSSPASRHTRRRRTGAPVRRAAVLRPPSAVRRERSGTMARTLSRDVAERGAEPGFKKVALPVDDESGLGGIDVRRRRFDFDFDRRHGALGSARPRHQRKCARTVPQPRRAGGGRAAKRTQLHCGPDLLSWTRQPGDLCPVLISMN